MHTRDLELLENDILSYSHHVLFLPDIGANR
jgi:hypothetical protein